MVKIDKFGEDFLLLALRIDKHIKGYVDFYIGPEKLKQLVASESIISPMQLLRNCEIMQKSLSLQGYDKDREKYLGKHLIAMKTSIESLNGVEKPFKEKIFNLYDVDLQLIDESKLYDLKEELGIAYGRSSSLEERMKELRERRKIPTSEVFELFKKALKIVKNRTSELFPNLLPNNESVVIDLIRNRNDDEIKWSYYNWYLGNYVSRIEVNPSYDMYWSSLLSSAAHEGYPGHHTEFLIKEKRLYHKLFQFEHSILLLNSPKIIISEGIASVALNALYSYRDQSEISLKEFCQNEEEEDSLDTIINQFTIKRKIDFFLYNLAYHAVIDEWSKEQLFRYATSFEIFSKENIKNQIKRLFDPVYSTTMFSYFLGPNLIINKYSEFPSVDNFHDLLIKPVLPSDLV